MKFTYLDFEATIDSQHEEQYLIRIRSPVGEASAVSTFSALAVPAVDTLSPLIAQEVGSRLFAMLLGQELQSLYYESRRAAEQQDKGLRIKLILPPALAVLPWELLFDPREGEFVALSQQTPLVRYLEVAKPERSLQVDSPLQILGIAANPADVIALDLATEKQQIEAALQPLGSAAQVTWLEPPTWQALLRAIRSQPWHIIHFVGHGAFDQIQNEGQLFFTDNEGNAQSVNATQFARLIADQRTLRLVTLNACEGAMGSATDQFVGTAATLIRRGLPAVVAMQAPVSDLAAIEFCTTFYDALAAGSPVDAALTDARKAMSFMSTDALEWGLPILFMRAPNGELFQQNENATATAGSGQIETNKPTSAPPQPAQPGQLFQTTVNDSEVGEVINVNTVQGGLTINKQK